MRILVCPPDHFGVDYVINPWMESQVGRADREGAHREWSCLVEDMVRFAAVEEVAAVAGSPDMCFTANAGLVAGDQVVPARFRMPERQGEEAPFVAWFRSAGFEVNALGASPGGSGSEAFEGEGDALFQPGEPLLWAGYGARSARSTHASLGDVFGVEVVSLRLVDSRFYHLDTCFAPLPGGRLAYYPAAFDDAGRRAIENRFAPSDRIVIEEADANAFACNMLRIDDRIFLNAASEGLQRRLAEWGFETRIHPVAEFMKAGGGVKCLSLMLEQPPFQSRLPFGMGADSSTCQGAGGAY